MFLGHFAVALAAKRAAPQASLGALFAAAQLPDIVWPVLVLTETEQVEIHPGDTAFTPLHFTSYPWSHSLLMVATSGVVAGALYGAATRQLRHGVVVALLVVSHWVLDWISHRSDMPLAPGSGLYGLGLWNSVPATLAVEVGLFVAGLLVYIGVTTARDNAGRYGFWSMSAFLIAVYLGNEFGPPPPSARAVAWAGLAGAAVLLTWASWSDRHRDRRPPETQAVGSK